MEIAQNPKLRLRLWHLELPYKLVVFLARCFDDALPVKANLSEYATAQDLICPERERNQETLQHILIHTKYTWDPIQTASTHNIISSFNHSNTDNNSQKQTSSTFPTWDPIQTTHKNFLKIRAPTTSLVLEEEWQTGHIQTFLRTPHAHYSM